MTMTAKKISETQLQIQCVRWFNSAHKKTIMFHIPNGGRRSITEAVKFKRMGVLSGVPDIFVASSRGAYGGLFIEIKTDKGKLTTNQSKTIMNLVENAYKVAVVRSLEEFIKVVDNYLNIDKNITDFTINKINKKGGKYEK